MSAEAESSAVNLRYDATEKAPLPVAALVGAQIVALILAGIVLAPLVITRATGLESQASWLIFAALIVCGLCTLLQASRIGIFGCGFVLFMGSNAAYVPVSLDAIAAGGLALMTTLVAVSGFVQFAFSMSLGRLRQIITPAVGGTVVMLIAVSIMPIAVDLIAKLPASVNSTGPHQSAAAATFVSIILIIIFAGPKLRLWAPLIGVGLGCAVAYSEGLISFQTIAAAPWIGLPAASWPGMDLSFGEDFWTLLPAFAIVTLVGGIETYADATAVQRVALRKQKPIDFRLVQGSVNADAAGNLLSGLAGTVPNTVYSTSVAVAEITGIAARQVAYFGGVFLILIAFSPKLASVLMAIPNPVVGAYIAVLLALLFSHGLRLVNEGRPDFATGFVVTISFWIGVAMQNKWLFNAEMPAWFTTMFGSGTTSGGIVAIVLMGLLQAGKGRAVKVDLTTDKAGAETLRTSVLAFCARAGWNKITTGRLAIATDETFAYIAGQTGPGRSVRLVLKRTGGFAEAEFVSPNLAQNLLSDTSADEHLEAIRGLAFHVEHRQFYGRDYISVQMPLPRAADEPLPAEKPAEATPLDVPPGA